MSVIQRNPKLSIGLPVYNGDNYLRDALDSLLTQTFGDFEIVISDNASTDKTQEICEEYAAKDMRIRYERQAQNQGAAANYNRTFELARGELFKWTAHDDICLPTFLEKCIETLDQAGPDTVLAYTAATTIDADGDAVIPDPYASGDFLRPNSRFAAARVAHTLRYMSMVNAVFGVIRSEHLGRTRRIGPFVASDYVLMLELAMLGRFSRLDEKLLLRREHPEGSRHAANPTLADVEKWFRGENSGKTLLPPRLKLMLEYYRSSLGADVALGTRLTCAGIIIPAMAERKLRVTTGRWKRQIMRRTSPT